MLPTVKSRISFEDLIGYVSVMLRHLRLMTLLFCLVLTAGMFYYSFSKPVFYAVSHVALEGLPRPADQASISRDTNTYAIIRNLQSSVLAERTARALGYRMSAGEVNQLLIRRTRVMMADGGVLRIQVWSYVPEVAQEWGKALVEQFDADRRERRVAYRNLVVSTYTQEMAMLAEQYRRSKIEAMSFEERNRLTELEAELARLRQLPAALRAVEGRIARIEAIHNRLKSSELDTLAKLSIMAQAGNVIGPKLGDELDVVPIGAGTVSEGEQQVTRIIVTPGDQPIGNPWDELARKRAGIVTEIERQSAHFLEAHRVIRGLRADLATVDRELGAMLRERERTFLLGYSNALQERREILEGLRVLHDRQRQVDTLTLERNSMMARGMAWDRFHSQLADFLGKIDFATGRERVDLRYLGLQEFSGSTVTPNKGKLLMASVGFGLALAVGVAFLLEFFDNSVTRLERVEEELSVRALGLVPLISENPQLASGVERERQVKHIAENFRVVRTNVMLGGGSEAVPEDSPKVILVTSSIPREGKTFVSTNLARSFAQLGERTLLIDADMRRGRIHRSFGFTRDEGLRNLLLGEITLDQAIVPGDHPNLSVIGSGRYSVEAIEKLGNETFRDLIAELRLRYDRVIIDSPPMLGLPEVAMMQPAVDGNIFVIWAGHTPLSSIKTSVASLKTGGEKVLGFVLNRLDLSASTHYGKYYYYSYDYYYSYTEAGQRV